MSTKIARCEAKKFGTMFGIQCQLATTHDGPHWALASREPEPAVHIWIGDDSVPGDVRREPSGSGMGE